MPNPLENKLLLYYMSGIGGAMGGPGSVAQTIGGMTQQQIQTESFQRLIKTLLAGGAKYGMDKDGISLKAPIGAFADTDLSIPGFEESYGKVSAVGAGIPERRRRPEYTAAYSPSASPLDVGGADLAGLTPENISQALQLKFMTEEIGRKTAADLTRAGYYEAAAEKMRVETAAIPGEQFLKAWNLASKDTRSAALKLYDRYVEQEEDAGRTPKSLEDWTLQVAKASGQNLDEFLAKLLIKERVTTESELAGPDFVQDIRTDLMKDARKWGYPPAYESLVGKGLDETKALDLSQKMMVVEEMEARIKSFYKGKEVVREKDGWYVDGKLVVRNPYYGRR